MEPSSRHGTAQLRAMSFKQKSG